jgi:2-polyprenyl-3-methyl-5-hydroxy-6-metoxy-1,4-benzoquinol methylase
LLALEGEPAMSREPRSAKDFADMPDLEKRVVTVLSLFETGRRVEDSDEYILPTGNRVKPTIEGIKSFLKDGASIEEQRMLTSLEELLKKGLIIRKSDCYFLTDTGKTLGKKFRTERMSKGYDDLLSRTGASRAYSLFCERVFGMDLSQFNVLDMEQLNTLIKQLDLKPEETALDLGCGNGRIAEYISDITGARITGLDFASELIKTSQQRTADKKDRLTYVVGNVDELAFGEGSFDAVISIDTLYFVESIDATVKNLKRLLKTSTGRLAIFSDQNVNPDESRDLLLPENTKVGKALRNNGLTYQAVDFTANSRQIWIREIQAADELKDLFIKEGNTDIYEDRAKDAKQTLESIESGRHVRFFYLARLEKQT